MVEQDNEKEQYGQVKGDKDSVTTQRGLQQWGPEAPTGMEGEVGTGSSGTAARQARITQGQLAQKERQQENKPHHGESTQTRSVPDEQE